MSTPRLIKFLRRCPRRVHEAYMSERPKGQRCRSRTLPSPLHSQCELAGAFEKTNKRTGLPEWLERSPQVRSGLPRASTLRSTS